MIPCASHREPGNVDGRVSILRFHSAGGSGLHADRGGTWRENKDRIALRLLYRVGTIGELTSLGQWEEVNACFYEPINSQEERQTAKNGYRSQLTWSTSPFARC